MDWPLKLVKSEYPFYRQVEHPITKIVLATKESSKRRCWWLTYDFQAIVEELLRLFVLFYNVTVQKCCGYGIISMCRNIVYKHHYFVQISHYNFMI